MHLRQLIQPDADWLDAPSPQRVARVALTACAGLAIYGFTVGFWRDPLMGGYVAVKLPLLIALTLGCNGLLNGLLGLLLGTGLGFRQSLLALLTSFALAALILGSLAPVTFFLAWNAPPPDSLGFMGTLAIGAWVIAVFFALRFLKSVISATGGTQKCPLAIWSIVFLLVTLQMTTFLRPILGRSDVRLTQEKKFFLQHWADTFATSLKPETAAKPASEKTGSRNP